MRNRVPGFNTLVYERLLQLCTFYKWCSKQREMETQVGHNVESWTLKYWFRLPYMDVAYGINYTLFYLL